MSNGRGEDENCNGCNNLLSGDDGVLNKVAMGGAMNRGSSGNADSKNVDGDMNEVDY